MFEKEENDRRERERENEKTICEKKGKQKIIKNTKQAGYWVRKVRKQVGGGKDEK